MIEKIKELIKNFTNEQLNTYEKSAQKECDKFEDINFKFAILTLLGLLAVPISFIFNLIAGICASGIFAGIIISTGIINTKLKNRMKKLELIKQEKEKRAQKTEEASLDLSINSSNNKEHEIVKKTEVVVDNENKVEDTNELSL